ncbi:hypothetical protein [Escherichia coli]|uniref:hypothetical protein n=1 Tax=Escherichia coli TaxID=562 RepID=UPI001BFC8ED7|nr:hypothetical protein [Escherichia coli]
MNTIDEMFYRVDGDDIRVSIDGCDWQSPFVDMTREIIEAMLYNGVVVMVSDL